VKYSVKAAFLYPTPVDVTTIWFRKQSGNCVGENICYHRGNFNSISAGRGKVQDVRWCRRWQPPSQSMATTFKSFYQLKRVVSVVLLVVQRSPCKSQRNQKATIQKSS